MAESLQTTLNRADPNTLADALRSLKFGDILRALQTSLRRSGTAASASVAAAASVVSKQAVAAPAAVIASAYARAGAGAPGPLTVVAYPPAAPNDVAIAPNGAVVTLAADAWTDVDVTYAVEKGDVVEFIGSVAAGVMPLPSNLTAPGVVMLLEAEALVAGVTGIEEIVAPGAAPAGGEAALDAGKTAVLFNAGDAVTRARAKLLIASSVDVSAALAADSTFV